jgi:branched-chain amino acid transport system substrate-binding protein
MTIIGPFQGSRKGTTERCPEGRGVCALAVKVLLTKIKGQQPMRRYSIAGGSLLLAAGMTLAACGSGSPSSSSAGSGQVTVLNINDLSGSSAALGLSSTAALKAGAAYLNANGGILGKKVVIDTVNDNGDPTTAISDLDSYLASHSSPPTMVSPGVADTDGSALLPVLAKDGILSIHGSVTDTYYDVKQSPEAYSYLGPVSDQEQALVNYIVKQGYKSVGILSEDIAFTEDETTYFQQELKAKGITYTTVSFSSSALNLTAQMSQLQRAHPQAILVAALYASAGYALVARADIGWTAPVIGDPAFGDSNVTALVPKADVKDVSALIFNCDAYVPPAKRSAGLTTFLHYLSPYRASSWSGIPINSMAGTWDALMLLKSAAEQAKSTNTAALVKALDHLKNQYNPLYVIFPRVGFSATSHANIFTSPSDYTVAPVGSVVDGFIVPAS